LIVLALAGCCAGARAQDHAGLQGSVGLHFPLDVADAVDARIGFAASLRYPFAQGPSGTWSGELQYSLFTARGNRYVHLLLPELEYAPNLFPCSRWELGVGVGPLFAWNNSGGSATDVGVTLAARYRLPRGDSAELRWMRGPKEGESGILLSYVFPFRR
jgi:hypothetical protein